MDELDLNILEEGDELSEGLLTVRLKDFDGPFDTLCYLIKKSKYSIADVKISEITEQYLQYMQEISEIDLEKASSFITMAAWLLEIKSKSMLPKPVIEEQVAYEDTEEYLREKLQEYSLLKDAAQKMKECESVDIHYREPDKSVGQPRFVLKSLDMSGLMGALQRVFLKLSIKAEDIKERHIVKDRYTVDERITYIIKILEEQNTSSFFALFDEDFSKSEIITTFQALLELMKKQFLITEQAEVFGDILLKRFTGE